MMTAAESAASSSPKPRKRIVIRSSTTTASSRRRVVKYSSTRTWQNDQDSIENLPASLEWLLWHLPLLLLASLFLIFMTLSNYSRNVVIPFLKDHLEWTPKRQDVEQTYPPVVCDELSTYDSNDFYFDSSNATETHLAVESVIHHGLALFGNVLDHDHATQLRSFILRRNELISSTSEELPVIAKLNRWSLALDPNDDDSVRKVLHEIYQSPLLHQTLEHLLGTNPAIVELSSITSAKGAAHQYFHADTEPESSALRFGQSIVPMYSLLIPLQDTTLEMGPTSVCPGSQRCSATPICFEDGFRVMPPATNVWKTGTAVLYNSQTRHRGSANESGPHRAVLIISFASRPQWNVASNFARILPLGATYAMKWNTWGLTWTDLEDISSISTVARALELTATVDNDGDSDNSKGWTAWRSWAVRMANEQYRFMHSDLIDSSIHNWGLFRYLPWILRAPISKSYRPHAWPRFLLKTIDRIQWFLAASYIAFLLAAVIVTRTSSLNEDNNKKQQRTSNAAVLLIIVQASFLCGGGWILQQQVHKFSYEPTRITTPSQVSRPIDDAVAPVTNDVLIGTRQKGFGAQSFVLDYHPGNLRLRQDVLLQYSNSFLFDTKFPNSGLELDALRSTMCDRRFLREDLAFGDWIPLTMTDAMAYVKQEMIQAWLYPDLALIRSIRDKNLCATKENKAICAVAPFLFDKVFFHSTKSTQRLPSHLRWTATPQLWTQRREGRSRQEGHVIDSKQDEVVGFRVGDRVEVHPHANSLKWFAGTVLARRGNEYKIQYDISDRGDFDVVQRGNMRSLLIEPNKCKRIPTIKLIHSRDQV